MDSYLNEAETALVIRRISDGRFFCGFDKRHRVKTAWCLAGAQFFQTDDDSHDKFTASWTVDVLGSDKWMVVPVAIV